MGQPETATICHEIRFLTPETIRRFLPTRVLSWRHCNSRCFSARLFFNSPKPIGPSGSPAFADRSHLTRWRWDWHAAIDCLTPVKDRIDRNLACNAERWPRIKAVYQETACAFNAEGLDFVVLKGFTHCPSFVSDPRHRPQNDIDLLFPQDQVFRARDIAAGLGYEPIRSSRRVPLDHLPTMIRRTGWQWRGDYFDPEIPLSLELHFRLWDEATERFGPE